MSLSLKTTLATFVILGSFAAQADGFRCTTKDGKSTLVGATNYATGDSLTAVPVLVQGSRSTKLDVSQYKNIDGELFFYSVMDLGDPRGIPANRVVRLDVKYSDVDGSGRGTLSVHTDFGGREIDPVKVSVTCKVN